MLVPAMQSIGTCSSSRTLSTPMCAAPRAPPPLSTRQIFGRVSGALTAAAGSAPLAGQATSDSASTARDAWMLFMPPLSTPGVVAYRSRPRLHGGSHADTDMDVPVDVLSRARDRRADLSLRWRGRRARILRQI